jgi:hypothetical protein
MEELPPPHASEIFVFAFLIFIEREILGLTG